VLRKIIQDIGLRQAKYKKTHTQHRKLKTNEQHGPIDGKSHVFEKGKQFLILIRHPALVKCV